MCVTRMKDDFVKVWREKKRKEIFKKGDQLYAANIKLVA